jgi:hypothetical protein
MEWMLSFPTELYDRAGWRSTGRGGAAADLSRSMFWPASMLPPSHMPTGASVCGARVPIIHFMA